MVKERSHECHVTRPLDCPSVLVTEAHVNSIHTHVHVLYKQFTAVAGNPVYGQPAQCIPVVRTDRVEWLWGTLLTGGSASGRGRGGSVEGERKRRGGGGAEGETISTL